MSLVEVTIFSSYLKLFYLAVSPLGVEITKSDASITVEMSIEHVFEFSIQLLA